MPTVTMIEPNHIYQFSLLTALMAGISTHGIPVSQISTSAGSGESLGLGTFAMMDGELVHLNGVTYQLRADGTVREAAPDDILPFLMITHFAPTKFFTNVDLTSKDALHDLMGETFPHCDQLFVSYRVTGHFKYLKVRTVRGQSYAGQPLSELGETQQVFEIKDTSGIVVGFRSPMAWQGLPVAGEHMHFLSDDRKRGGHILALETAKGVKVEAALVKNLHVELPQGRDFNDADLRVDDTGIKKVEG